MARTSAMVLATVAWIGVAAAAQAAYVRIPTLFNTGVDAAGHPLPNDTIGDPHYNFATLDSVPAPSSADIRVFRGGPTGLYPIGPWAGDDDVSAWIGPANHDRGDNPAGRYYYHTSFDLTGFDPSTALIYGYWGVDDYGAQIRLNTTNFDILNVHATVSDDWTKLSPFDYYFPPYGSPPVSGLPISTGFVAGINDLYFRIDNQGGPTGFRAELFGFAVPVPEPASGLLLLLPVALLLAAPRRVSR